MTRSRLRKARGSVVAFFEAARAICVGANREASGVRWKRAKD
jgi:hypothetical protein